MSNAEVRSNLVSSLRQVAKAIEDGAEAKSFSIAKDMHGVYRVEVWLARSVADEKPSIRSLTTW